MKELAEEYAKARALVEQRAGARSAPGLLLDIGDRGRRDMGGLLDRVLTLVTSRITRPMEQLTAGLAELASGNLDARLAAARSR